MKVIKELIPYIIIIVAVVLIRTFIITPVKVDGDSMKETLNDNDILLLYKLGSIKRFDIVVLDEAYDNEKIIKRVIGMPGETVSIKNDKIYINGKIIDNSFAYGTTSDVDKIELGEDEYFILGDNRLISKDSRYFGPVTKGEIIGKVVFRLFSFNKIGTVK